MEKAMKLLHIDSSPSGSQSVTRELSAAVVQELHAINPALQITYRDLAEQPPAHMGSDLLKALRPQPGASLPDGLQQELDATEAMLSEFLAADVVVIGAPMYNFSIPTQLKAWIDRLAQPGRTFKYQSGGPIGLAAGKKVVIVSSRGGMYAGTAAEQVMDHQEAYLRAVLGFFGITEIEVIRAEGIGHGADVRASAIAAARNDSRALAEECELAGA
jgi:FMN-dependent NADH-azoreductase